MPVIYVNASMGIAKQVIKKVDGDNIEEIVSVPLGDLVTTLMRVADENKTKDICLMGPKRFIAPFKEQLNEKGYNLIGKVNKNEN